MSAMASSALGVRPRYGTSPSIRSRKFPRWFAAVSKSVRAARKSRLAEERFPFRKAVWALPNRIRPWSKFRRRARAGAMESTPTRKNPPAAITANRIAHRLRRRHLECLLDGVGDRGGVPRSSSPVSVMDDHTYLLAKMTSRCEAEKRGVQVVRTSVGALVGLRTHTAVGDTSCFPVT
jgi:hypothetical protein